VDDFVSSQVGDVPIIEQDLTPSSGGKPNDGSNQGGLANPVSTQKGYHGPFGNLQTDPLEDIAIAVIGMDIHNLQHKIYSPPK
jgi:hypothetical protein